MNLRRRASASEAMDDRRRGRWAAE